MCDDDVVSLITLAWVLWGGLAAPVRACTCAYDEQRSGYLVYPPEEVAVATDAALVWLNLGPSGDLRLSGPSGAVALDVAEYDNGLGGFRVARPREALEPESLYVVGDGSSNGYFCTSAESASARPGDAVLDGVCGEHGAGSDCVYYVIEFELPALESGLYVVEVEQANYPPRYALMEGDDRPAVGRGVCGSSLELADDFAPMATRVAALSEAGELSAWSERYVGELGSLYESACFVPLVVDTESPPCGCDSAAGVSLLAFVAWGRRVARPGGSARH